ncbi:hypothetical protein [Mariniblastus fucicola]|uniref:Uncharacterized protein n=1 Tax=Mariniblastus fucicola TaxID=980251 RepID=A0A5B9PHM6_9BACT|nr:hypothetical protein [Mariniblastus fucicola]QEG24775.1 hypothetical protein MFFC18_46980 [Mariniblastus fucicola]
MKSIEEEILETFLTSRRQTNNKARDARGALAYYGFSNDVLPSMEVVGKKYSIGKRQRVEQVLGDYFRTNPRIKQIDGIQAAAKLVSAQPVSFWSDIQAALCKFGFISNDYVAAHLLLLLQDLGFCEEFELFTPTGEKVTRSNSIEFEQFIFVHRDAKKAVSKDIIKLRKLPAGRGMATLDAANLTHFSGNELQRLIDGIPDSWQCQDEGQTWFLFEDRDSRLVNQMEKAYCTGSTCKITRLAEALEIGLRNGSAKPGFPPLGVIRSYLRSSKLTRVENDRVTFNGEEGKLSDIEIACIQYFDSINRQPVDSKTLKAHLESANFDFGEPLIESVIYRSSLIHIDKSGGPRNYQYSLACDEDGVAELGNGENDRYQEFVNRLKDIAELGTDAEHEATRRREQDLLGKWIFADNERECCGLCGKEFERAALRTAHKKKRSECSESERIDPYVVMPICLFGCDYLYERKLVTVREGKVTAGPESSTSAASSEAIALLVGREVDERWTAGSPEYFH